jgi:hypothetical protein
VVLEHVRRLDDVVIDADQNHVFFVHGRSLPNLIQLIQRTAAPERASASRHLPPSSLVENYLLAK